METWSFSQIQGTLTVLKEDHALSSIVHSKSWALSQLRIMASREEENILDF